MPNTNIDKRDPRGWTPLMMLCRYGTPAQVLDLIEAGANLQVKDAHSMTPLAIATYYNPDPDVVAALLYSHAKTTGPYRYDQLPIHHAARYGTPQHIRDALNNTKLDANHTDLSGDTPLHLAARYATPEGIQLLLDAGANIESNRTAGRTPLHVAARYGPPENSQALLNAGANLSATNRDGRTALMFAAQNRKHWTTIRVLAKNKTELEQTDRSKNTALTISIKAALPNNTHELLEAGANPNQPTGDPINLKHPIRVAYEELGRRKPHELELIILQLISAGAHYRGSDTQSSALVYAARYGAPNDIAQLLMYGAQPEDPGEGGYALVAAATAKHQDNVRALLAAGANPNGNERITAIHQVIRDDTASLSILTDLLKAGANPNQMGSSESRLALTMAAQLENRSKAAALLIEYGADTEATCGKGRTPLGTAIIYSNGEVARLLLDAGANPNQADNNGLTPLLVSTKYFPNPEFTQLLLKCGADIEVACPEGRTPLHHAVMQVPAESDAHVKFLLAAGANIEARDNRGNTALNAHCEAESNRAARVKLLLDAGANPTSRDNEGNTPLHKCQPPIFVDELQTIEALLAADADLNAKNNAGDTPLAHAKKNAHHSPQVMEVFYKLLGG